MNSKKICIGIIICLILIIIGCQIFKIVQIKRTNNKPYSEISKTNEEILEVDLDEGNEEQDEIQEEIDVENAEVKNTEIEDKQQETKTTETINQKTTNSSNTSSQSIQVSSQSKTPQTQTSTTSVQVNESESEVKSDEIEQPIQNNPEQTQENSYDITKEKDIRNDEMINKIKNVINSNPSEYMLQYGYTIVVDSSIKELTNQFTFTEDRVKNMIRYSFGTIKIYAEDHYYDGQFIMTECYLL